MEDSQSAISDDDSHPTSKTRIPLRDNAFRGKSTIL